MDKDRRNRSGHAFLRPSRYGTGGMRGHGREQQIDERGRALAASHPDGAEYLKGARMPSAQWCRNGERKT
jgi:hypothetical protein